MQVDMSALSFDEIQEVMNVMSSFDNIFRDSSERERSLFLGSAQNSEKIAR